jgi:thymidylate kinase
MILKFDGIDGCGKSTISRAVAEALGRHYSVVVVSEFANPTRCAPDSSALLPMETLRIRDVVLDPQFGCDDVERQLLLHFLSRRKNRIELPHLDGYHDYVIVDRSTLSNYAYGSAIDPAFSALSDLAVAGIEKAEWIFWIDTPVDTCMERISQRLADAVECKGRSYFLRVRQNFERLAARQATIRTLDGRWAIPAIVEYVLEVLEGPRRGG